MQGVVVERRGVLCHTGVGYVIVFVCVGVYVCVKEREIKRYREACKLGCMLVRM